MLETNYSVKCVETNTTLQPNASMRNSSRTKTAAIIKLLRLFYRTSSVSKLCSV